LKWTWERKAITFLPITSSTAPNEFLFHRSLEGEAGLFDGCLFACLDQCPLDRRIEVVEESDYVVAFDDRARLVGSAAVVFVMEAGDRVRDRERAMPIALKLARLIRHRCFPTRSCGSDAREEGGAVKRPGGRSARPW